MTTEFDGRIALVTAAAGAGIGQATARRLAAGGARVVVTDIHERRTREVAAAIAADHPDTTVVGLPDGCRRPRPDRRRRRRGHAHPRTGADPREQRRRQRDRQHLRLRPRELGLVPPGEPLGPVVPVPRGHAAHARRGRWRDRERQQLRARRRWRRDRGAVRDHQGGPERPHSQLRARGRPLRHPRRHGGHRHRHRDQVHRRPPRDPRRSRRPRTARVPSPPPTASPRPSRSSRPTAPATSPARSSTSPPARTCGTEGSAARAPVPVRGHHAGARVAARRLARAAAPPRGPRSVVGRRSRPLHRRLHVRADGRARPLRPRRRPGCGCRPACSATTIAIPCSCTAWPRCSTSCPTDAWCWGSAPAG